MSLFGEFHVPASDFACTQVLQDHPEMVIEIERVVAADEYLTPYFWVSDVDLESFERSIQNDSTIQRLRRLDEFEEATLYRAQWTDRIEALVYAFTELGATVLEADGQASGWTLRMRFDDRDSLDDFNVFLTDADVPFTLERLYEIAHPRSGGQFGLTPKQYEALTTAWDMGYFALPRETTTTDVAAELDISAQALSDRLRRGQHQLIAETLRVVPPEERGF